MCTGQGSNQGPLGPKSDALTTAPLRHLNRSALVCELLSNNSLFVGQLYDDKSLTLHTRDLIFFTTDLQTVNYYSTILC